MIKATADARPGKQSEQVPVFRNKGDLESYVEQQAGAGVVDRIRAAKNTTEAKAILNEAFRSAHPEMNGDAEKMAERLSLNRNELEKKEGWFKWLLMAPIRGAKWVFKKTFVEHPILTTIAIGALLWYTGWGAAIIAPIQAWIAKLPDGSMVKNNIGKIFKLPMTPGAGEVGVNPNIGMDSVGPVGAPPSFRAPSMGGGN